MKNGISLLIADDHEIFRVGLLALLKDIKSLGQVIEAENGKQVLDLLERVHIDVVFLDINMPELNGFDVVKLAKERYPDVKIVVLSGHADKENIIKMLHAGASGYLSKDADKSELVAAIGKVMEGKSYFSGDVSNEIIEYFQSGSAMPKAEGGSGTTDLTPREEEILTLIAREKTNPEIAKELYISVNTVITHRRNILAKLEVKNTAGLVRYAAQNGLI